MSIRARCLPLGCVCATALVSGLALTGCDPSDPFAGNSDAGHARIINDEHFDVDVMLCEDDDCGKPHGVFFFADRYHNRETLEAGFDNPKGFFNVSKRGVPNVYLVVRTADQRPLGCLPFVMPEDGPALVARVSERVPCRGHWNEHVRWPR
jgi:hypothetical protein